MVTSLTSMVDGDDAPSTVDGGVALHGNLLNAPHNLFTARSSSRQQWFVAEEEEQPFPTMVTNGDTGEGWWWVVGGGSAPEMGGGGFGIVFNCVDDWKLNAAR
ncbi:hypothetical protein JHK84_045089 [Glycine max]|nr:hypothetical protein JHK85_045602 [Glycine max]KAG5108182.1 hypothetical protein JHK84_045089 [Glycine max]